MAKKIRTPLKQGKGGTASINAQIAALRDLIPLGEVQVPADWDQADDEAIDFIANKPTIPTTATEATAGTVLTGAAVDDATDGPSAITQLNALIASLTASGALASNE